MPEIPANVLAALGRGTLDQVGVRLSSSGARVILNQFPLLNNPDQRIAIIGEAPGAEEDECGIPFSGASGRFLNALLGVVGFNREQCFVGNICRQQPPDNDLARFGWDSEMVQNGLAALESDLAVFNPSICVLLGKWALYAACGEWRSMKAWRGSLFIGTHGPFKGRKCIATYHPASVLRTYEWRPLLQFDLLRAVTESWSKDLDLPRRRFKLGLTADQIVAEIEGIIKDAWERPAGLGGVWVSFDLEGYWNRITRFSIATSPTAGFIVPLTSGEYDSHWTLAEEARIWVATSRLLKCERVPKVLQNSLYDRFVLAYVYKILICNVQWDTMLGHWELFCEFDKNLGLQGSIYTREPHWKEDRESDDLTTREMYCCLDSAVTEECRQVQTEMLMQNVRSWNHMEFNMRMLEPIMYMELRGLSYNAEAAKSARATMLVEMWELKHLLNKAANQALVGAFDEIILKVAVERLCKKREGKFVVGYANLEWAAKKDNREACARLAEMHAQGLLVFNASDATLGELESLLELELNVDSSKQMCEWLYVTKGFERQYMERADGSKGLTSDVGACLTLFRKTQDPIIKTILKIRSLLYKTQVLQIKSDPDNRIRCGYNEVGTDTGRLNCYESPTGSGYNLQTVTKSLRYLIEADKDCWLGQCDLAGADGWTVAMHCYRLGDPTMLDDYFYGLKPAKIIARMYMQVESELHNIPKPSTLDRQKALAAVSKYFNSLTRAELLVLCNEVDQDGWLYFACKRCQHGSNYLMGEPTMSDLILKDSYKFLGDPIYVDIPTCRIIKQLYLGRYVGIERWQTSVANEVLSKQTLTAASGRTRKFFGRLRDGRGLNHDTHKVACSNEPQDNTTFATNCAVYNLWTDPSNRDCGVHRGRLIVEPLHQVHDAALLQWQKSNTDYALARIPCWFYTEIVIADRRIIIPFEGGYGPNWKDQKVGKINPLPYTFNPNKV